MRKLNFLLVLLMISSISFAQQNYKKYEQVAYSIEHPETWKIHAQGENKEGFIMFSEIEKNETFRENLNLTVQNISQAKYTLADFVAVSKSQLSNMVSNVQIIEDAPLQIDGSTCHVLTWSGNVQGKELLIKQHIYVKDGLAYVLSFNATVASFGRFKERANTILNSFKLL